MISHPIDRILAPAAVLPILTIDSEDDAIPLARALLEGGISVMEIPVRTAAALPAIRRLSEVSGICCGAGSVLNAADAQRAVDAGARFLVGPGFSAEAALIASGAGTPYLPGVLTPTEIMRGLDMGVFRFKLFPAEAAGGLALLGALEAPFPDVRFVPAGAIREDRTHAYVQRANVLSTGVSWVAPRDLIRAGAWDEIRHRAGRAAALSALRDQGSSKYLDKRSP
jgi:2-dehydro-3-deoxyphosphogluconate aldolase/(4S)-4-hydroxy-2-oxoglutarate aldolase